MPLVNGEPYETGCYVSDRMSADDMVREAIKIAETAGFTVPDDMRAIVDGDGWCDNPDDGEALTELGDYQAIPYLNDVTVGGYWSFDGERGGFYLDEFDDDDDDEYDETGNVPSDQCETPASDYFDGLPEV